MLSCRCLVTEVGLAVVFIFKCCCVVAAEFHKFLCLFVSGLAAVVLSCRICCV